MHSSTQHTLYRGCRGAAAPVFATQVDAELPQSSCICGRSVSPLSLLTPPSEQTRAELGFPPLVIVVIGLIYSRRRAAKLSSTDLREEDAAGR